MHLAVIRMKQALTAVLLMIMRHPLDKVFRNHRTLYIDIKRENIVILKLTTLFNLISTKISMY